MEVEKRNSKGGFLQLFDWNLKSKKKLFSTKSELSENVKQGKENVDGAATSRLQQVDEYGGDFGTWGESDLHNHSVSSHSGDERYGAKAPGVVARLMGLDSLPTSTVSEPFESESLRDSYTIRGTMDYENEHHIVMYESMRNKLDGLAKNPLEFTLEKVQNRLIERFQSEILPRKTANPVSITHNRLLSPIKSPGFIPPKNAAYLIEAAAKIVEENPRLTNKGKSPFFGSPSVSVRLHGLKEKIEAAQKSSKIPEVSRKSKNIKMQRCEKGDMRIFRDSESSKVGPKNTKSKEKSAGGCSMNRKQNIESKPSSVSKNMNQMKTRKCVETRTSSTRSSHVLKQNNQKQNCISNKDRENSKQSSASHHNERKVVLTSDMTRNKKIINRIVVDTSVGSGETNPPVVDFKKGFSESTIKKFSGKKRPISLNDRSDKSRTSKEERKIKGHAEWDAIDRKSGKDIVSFTFTSPIKKLPPRSDSSQAIEKKKSTSLITCTGKNDASSKYSTISSSGFNVVGGDALSVLLELKLKELTSRVECSHHDLVEVQSLSSSSNSFQDSVSTLNSMYTTFAQPDILCNSNRSYDEFELGQPRNWERREEMGEHSSCSYVDCGSDFDMRCLSPASSLEPSLSEDCSEVSDSKCCITSEAREPSNYLTDYDFDLAYSACSTSGVVAIRGSCLWELEYIKDIITNADLMLEEFVCGQVHQIIEPNLFHQLEIQITESNKNVDEPFKVAREALFDCVEECLELKSKHLFSGSFRAFAKLTTLCGSRDRLAEDLYREIVGWTNMVDLMVDEVVDMDMSSGHGKWVDFENETFEEGLEIEKEILSSLINELFDEYTCI